MIAVTCRPQVRRTAMLLTVTGVLAACAVSPTGDTLPPPTSVPTLREPVSTGPAEPAGPTVPDLPPETAAPPTSIGPVPVAPACAFASLRVTSTGAQGGGDHGGSVLLFRNTGRPCRLQGYPQVDLLDAHGKVNGHASPTGGGYLLGDHRLGSGLPPVYLATGATVSAGVEGIRGPDVGPTGQLIPCPLPISLRITPPGTHHWVILKAAPVTDIGDGCHPEVHPVVPGQTGYIN